MSEQAFYIDPEFWAAVSFCVLIFAIFRPVGKMIAAALDKRTATIATELAEARRLREEAQTLLALYQQKQAESIREAEAMLAHTRENAERMAHQGQADLSASLEKRMRMATDKIAQAERQAVQEVRAHVVDIALASARALLKDHLSSSESQALIARTTEELKQKLH